MPASLPPDSTPGTQGQADRTDTITLIAGLNWIGAALAFGFLAFLQLQYAPLAGAQKGELESLALANGVGAAITLFVGARLIIGASSGVLAGSAFWGVLSVLYGGWQISQGVTHEAFIIGTLLSGAAGVLSFIAWQRAPKTNERLLTGPAKVLLILIGLAAAYGVFIFFTR